MRVGGEHARDERREDRARGLGAEPARRERVHRLVLAAGRAWPRTARAGDRACRARSGGRSRTNDRPATRQRAQLAVEVDPARLRAPATPCRRRRRARRTARGAVAAVRRRTSSRRARGRSHRCSMVPTTPPARGPASSTCASIPAATSARAAISPPMPPPMTATFMTRDSSRTAVTIARTCSGSVSRQDAMAEIEDVSDLAGAREDVGDPRADLRRRREQRAGIEVALQRDAVADPPAHLVDPDPPVDAEHVGAARRVVIEVRRAAVDEVDDRHVARDRRARARAITCFA